MTGKIPPWSDRDNLRQAQSRLLAQLPIARRNHTTERDCSKSHWFEWERGTRHWQNRCWRKNKDVRRQTASHHVALWLFWRQCQLSGLKPKGAGNMGSSFRGRKAYCFRRETQKHSLWSQWHNSKWTEYLLSPLGVLSRWTWDIPIG